MRRNQRTKTCRNVLNFVSSKLCLKSSNNPKYTNGRCEKATNWADCQPVVDIDSASTKPAMGHHSREISLLNLMCFNMIPQNVQKFKFLFPNKRSTWAIKCFVTPKKSICIGASENCSIFIPSSLCCSHKTGGLMIVLGALFCLTSFTMVKKIAYITAHATSPKIDFCHGLCPTISP